MQIGVARNPPLEHVFGQSLRHLAHNNWRSRVERRSTPRGSPAGTEPPRPLAGASAVGYGDRTIAPWLF